MVYISNSYHSFFPPSLYVHFPFTVVMFMLIVAIIVHASTVGVVQSKSYIICSIEIEKKILD